MSIFEYINRELSKGNAAATAEAAGNTVADFQIEWPTSLIQFLARVFLGIAFG